MKIDEALELADNLIFARVGKHLNTLQVAIFRSSWLDRKYEQIAEEYYCSDTHVRVSGAELWDLLSKGLGEKVTKKTFRAALERHHRATKSKTTDESITSLQSHNSQSLQAKRISICHCDLEPDLNLALELEQALQTVGYYTSRITPSLERSPQWLELLDGELKKSDYVILFLSSRSAVDEQMTETIRQAKAIQESSQNRLIVIPIEITVSVTSFFNFDIRDYLQQIPQYRWHSPADTNNLLQAVLAHLASDILKSDKPTTTLRQRQTEIAATSLKINEFINSSICLSEPELPEGQVKLTSQLYIERPPIEWRCFQTIIKPGALIRIKAPQEMGKTSLMSRILHYASNLGYKVVSLDFQLADNQILQDLDTFLRWFCLYVSKQLNLSDRLNDYWDEIFGSKVSCKDYFEQYLLANLEQPLVIGLDRVDRIFQHPVLAEDFFGLLRAWYEEGKNSEIWQNFRLVVVHSTEVYIPLDINQSPFNIGLPVELPDFNPSQIQDLANRQGIDWNSEQTKRLMSMVGGHPHLIRVAFYHLALKELTLERLLEQAPTEAGLYSKHLRRHLLNLQKQPNLLTAFTRVVHSDFPVQLESHEIFKLHSMGLLKLDGNEVLLKYKLYREYFRERLGSGSPYKTVEVEN